jgi:hypothetical protein
MQTLYFRDYSLECDKVSELAENESDVDRQMSLL